jgi:hypothetical protein
MSRITHCRYLLKQIQSEKIVEFACRYDGTLAEALEKRLRDRKLPQHFLYPVQQHRGTLMGSGCAIAESLLLYSAIRL